MEGSDCTGVLALTVTEVDDQTLWCCEELGMLAGAAIGSAARLTDLFNLVRRRKAMSLPASMQWDLLPPLGLRTPEVTSNGVLEPAYDVGGDCFDHTVNGFALDVVIMDAMGHGLTSSVTAALAMGSYRHDRREGQSLATIHRRLDDVIADQFAGETFVTGQAARLALHSGELTWVNAGHPLPLLVRPGRDVTVLACQPSLPWGLGGPLQQQASDGLRPGDSVLFHTDGVTERRAADGEHFGIDRLIDLVAVAAQRGRPPSAVLHQLIRQVVSYDAQGLRDDATMVWVTWQGPQPR